MIVCLVIKGNLINLGIVMEKMRRVCNYKSIKSKKGITLLKFGQHIIIFQGPLNHPKYVQWLLILLMLVPSVDIYLTEDLNELLYRKKNIFIIIFTCCSCNKFISKYNIYPMLFC